MVVVFFFFFFPSKKLAREVNKGFGARQIWVQVQPLTDTCRVLLGKLTNFFDFFYILICITEIIFFLLRLIRRLNGCVHVRHQISDYQVIFTSHIFISLHLPPIIACLVASVMSDSFQLYGL